ncbi:MAG: DUF2119 domain-containing protein [Methanohalobium sp.]|uniref:DUF2119 domain-containing protein n=1 Tax=Methanohalobium sp. TaxID=2837493 RepID=UPI00397C071D
MTVNVYGHGNPVRLFVAGLHGDEWRDTSDILYNINPPEHGTLITIPVVNSGKYVSTLDENYYKHQGMTIIYTIVKYQPSIYVELHSYSGDNFTNLTDNNRINRIGIPAYSILDNNVLLGSVAPYIRRNYFSKEALCLSFEIKKSDEKSRSFAEKIINTVKECKSRDEFIIFLRKRYPKQAEKAIENYKKFYGL